MSRKYAGVWTALITPFKAGEIDWAAVAKLVEQQVAGGVTGVLVNGTTGESPCLSESEVLDLVRKVREMIDGRCLLMVGSGSNCTAKSCELSVKCAEAGADVLMIVNPYYNKPTQEGLFRHFVACASSVDKPVLIYNIKGRTGVNLETSTLVRVAAECANVIGVKEASGNLEQMKEVISTRVREDFVVLSGDDGLTAELMKMGGDGVVSVASNLIPSAIVDLVAGESQDLDEFFEKIFIETNPIPIKYLMHRAGYCELEYRLPMCEPTDGAKEILNNLEV